MDAHELLVNLLDVLQTEQVVFLQQKIFHSDNIDFQVFNWMKEPLSLSVLPFFRRFLSMEIMKRQCNNCQTIYTKEVIVCLIPSPLILIF
jgi:hypothetical protein